MFVAGWRPCLARCFAREWAHVLQSEVEAAAPSEA